MSQTRENPKFDHQIDITTDVCPMTFVRTKLLIEKMSPGETVQVRLRGGEPLINVPRSVREMGHTVLSIDETQEDDIHLIVIQTT